MSKGDLVPIPFKKFLRRLSSELPRWTPASEALFSTHFYTFILASQRVERFLVSVSHDHDSRVGILNSHFYFTFVLVVRLYVVIVTSFL